MPRDYSSIQPGFTVEESHHRANCMEDEDVGLKIPPKASIRDNLRQVAECKRIRTFGADQYCVLCQEQ